jgi:hypothetical protein
MADIDFFLIGPRNLQSGGEEDLESEEAIWRKRSRSPLWWAQAQAMAQRWQGVSFQKPAATRCQSGGSYAANPHYAAL